MNRKQYFTLNEIALLSLCGALIFVLKLALKIPLHLPGHSGIFWVIPAVVAVAIVRKPGAGTYVGFISGILTGFFGMDPLGLFEILNYFALGITVDIVSILFGYRLSNPVAGFIVGAAANVVKMIVNFGMQIFLGVSANFILIGIGIASLSHLIFGGLGGLIAAVIIARLARAGVIEGNAGPADD